MPSAFLVRAARCAAKEAFGADVYVDGGPVNTDASPSDLPIKGAVREWRGAVRGTKPEDSDRATVFQANAECLDRRGRPLRAHRPLSPKPHTSDEKQISRGLKPA